jgi:hypothetical protein
MKKSKSRAATEVHPDQIRTIEISHIRTHSTFVELLPVDEDLLAKMIEVMRAEGFYQSEPVVLAKWKGLEEPVLIDGHMRIRAASEAGITHVPCVTVEFSNEMEALQHAVNLQAVRRRTTDGAFYRLCCQYDALMDCGGDRRSEGAKSKMQRCKLDRGFSASARRTAQLIGCHYRKVDKIRKIRRDGWPEIQDAVRNDQCSINRAYRLIRDMEIGEDDAKGKPKLTNGPIKAVKSVLSEDNFVGLEGMGDDLGSLLNLAVEQFIGGLRDKERAEARKD